MLSAVILDLIADRIIKMMYAGILMGDNYTFAFLSLLFLLSVGLPVFLIMQLCVH